jgi:hypothetical protein
VTRRRVALGAAALLTVPLAAASCGVPTGGAPETIAASDVPYGLASPSPTGAPVTSDPARMDEPRIYLVDGHDVLVPRGRDMASGTLRERLGELLTDLAAGPTPSERSDQLSTALPPGLRLSVGDIDGDTVTIALVGSGNAPSGRESRRAVAQIVLTATSLEGIGRVLLTRDGAPVEAPLPSGELTSEPLTSAEYAGLLTAPPP